MARKVSGQQKPAAPKGAAGVNDLDILQPDRQVTIDGEVITVREYRFFEGLQLRTRARPFFDELYGLFADGGAAPSFDDVSDVLGRHEDAVVAMVCQASGRDPDWVRALDDQDGEALLLTWWLVNSGFFIRRVLRRAAQARLAPAGPASSTPSSPAATSEASMSLPG